jgi:Zn-finger nucleic acid-binding protein
MLCPTDKTAMLSQQREDVQYECCPTCNGVWFGPRHLLTLDLPPDLYPKGLKAFALANGQAHDTEVTVCHDCGTGLLNVTIEGIGVDICPSCGGAWLPAKEFDRVLAWYEERRKKNDGDADYEQDSTDHDSSKQRKEDDFVPIDQVHVADGEPSSSDEDCGPDEGTLTAVIDFVSAVCKGVGDVVSFVGKVASALADDDG